MYFSARAEGRISYGHLCRTNSCYSLALTVYVEKFHFDEDFESREAEVSSSRLVNHGIKAGNKWKLKLKINND